MVAGVIHGHPDYRDTGIPGWMRVLFIVFFASHIPITLFIDGQAAYPELHPKPLKDLLAWYVKSFNDPLMGSPPDWFKTIVKAELFLQLPFFFVAIYGLVKRRNWVRIPAIIYGSHVVTTLIPILAAFAQDPRLSDNQRHTLIAIYSPYLLVPLLLLAVMAADPEPFGRPPLLDKKQC